MAPRNFGPAVEVMSTGLSEVIEPFFRLGEKLAEACMIFLTVAVAIRTLLLLVEVVLDDGATLASLFSRMARGAVLVSVLLVALTNWGAIQSGVIEGAYAAAKLTTSVVSVNGMPQFDAGSNAEAVGQTVIRPIIEVVMGPIDRASVAAQVFHDIEKIWILTGETPPAGANLVDWTQSRLADERSLFDRIKDMGGIVDRAAISIGKAILLAVMLVALMLACLFLGAVVLFYVLKAMLTILISMAMLPFGVSISPISRDLVEKGFGAILGGIGQLCVVVFIGCLGANAANQMLLKMVDGSIPYSDVGMFTAIQLVCLLTVVAALLVPSSAQIAARLFDGFSVGSSLRGSGMLKAAVSKATMNTSRVVSAIKGGGGSGPPMKGGGGKPGGDKPPAPSGGGGKPGGGGSTPNFLEGYEPRRGS